MKQIPLTKGLFAIVDDEDFERLSRYRWRAMGKYATRSLDGGGYAMMHRDVLGVTDKSILVDHKNGDSLDNRRHNLRPCTKQQNNFNRGKSWKNTTGFKGVIASRKYPPDKMKYAAQISNNGRMMGLGIFATKEEAARAYDEAAKRMHGEFAVLNFPEAGEAAQ